MKHPSLFWISLIWLHGALLAPGLCRTALPQDETARLSLNGTWFAKTENLPTNPAELRSIDADTWQSVNLPGNAALLGLGDGPVYLFARHFDVPDKFRHHLIRLAFQGVDYESSVWLNGHHLGDHEGYFAPFAFSLEPDHLKPKNNFLVVRVVAYPETNTLHKQAIKGVLSHHDTRPGGAWSARGQEKTTAGIWGDVTLHLTKDIAITNWSLRYDLDLVKREITPEITLDLEHRHARSRTFEVVFKLEPANFTARQVALKRWRERVRIGAGTSRRSWQLSPRPVALWWPFELGHPNLYHFRIEIYRRGALVAQAHREVGFRQITRETAGGAWRINGQRTFLRGTNYIGTIWLAQATPSLMKRDIGLMKQAHINAVRVHAHITHPVFYRECDRQGMLIWQDFPLQWGYTDHPDFAPQAIAQAQSMVSLLEHHPSIFTWCPHNEPPWDASWMVYKYPDYQPGQNRELDTQLVHALQEADPSRYVHPHSATAEHPWLGWYSGHWRDYGKPTKEPLITEFGAQALPDERVLRRFIPTEVLVPESKADWQIWEYHNFQHRETFEIAKIERGADLQTFIANSQNYQARLIQRAAEAYRMQRYEPVTAIFQFMFVEHWPSINWGIVDYLRNPKPGWTALQRAYQPVLPLIVTPKDPVNGDLNPDRVQLWVINDSLKRYPKAQIEVTLDKLPDPWNMTLVHTLDPDAKTQVATFSLPELPQGAHKLLLQVRQANGDVVAFNHWSFTKEKEAAP